MIAVDVDCGIDLMILPVLSLSLSLSLSYLSLSLSLSLSPISLSLSLSLSLSSLSLSLSLSLSRFLLLFLSRKVIYFITPSGKEIADSKDEKMKRLEDWTTGLRRQGKTIWEKAGRYAKLEHNQGKISLSLSLFLSLSLSISLSIYLSIYLSTSPCPPLSLFFSPSLFHSRARYRSSDSYVNFSVRCSEICYTSNVPLSFSAVSALVFYCFPETILNSRI